MRTPFRFKHHIVCFYLIRVHMTIIVLATTAAGLLVSKILLEAGLTNILVRYPLSVVGAYLVFLGLARLWSSYVLWRESPWFPDWLELLDGLSSPGHSSTEMFAGGNSGGAGASGSWASDHFDAAGIDVDLGEAAGVVIVLVGLILVLFGAGIYVIYWAPDILPEVALNVLLASCLTGAAKSGQSKRWIYGILRSTRSALTVVVLTSLGLAVTIRHRCPQAEKLVDVQSCVLARQIHPRQSPR